LLKSNSFCYFAIKLESDFSDRVYRKNRFKLKASVFACLVVLYLSTFFGWVQYVDASAASISDLSSNESEYINSLEFIPLASSVESIRSLKAMQANIIKENENRDKVNKVENLLARYNSPMKGLGKLLVSRTEECGGDYRIVVAIAGNESGFGRIPYKKYNPFGYLDGVQYANWEDAINVIACKISERFIKPCSGDLTCIIRTYGGPDTDKEKWIRNIRWFMNQL
jgi:hypothetical protein